VEYYGSVPADKQQIKAADDASQADWFPVNKHPKLAFDHEKVLKEAFKIFKNH
jgi:8-oxo-dGTP diphosphatase